MTIEEIKLFAEKMSKVFEKACKNTAEELKIKDNRLYIDTVELGLYDARSCGRDSSCYVKGTIVFVEEEKLLQYLSLLDMTEDQIKEALAFFYSKQYVSFKFEEGVTDCPVKLFLGTILKTLSVSVTFISSGALLIEDQESETEVKTTVLYGSMFSTVYTMVKDIYDIAGLKGNGTEWETVLSSVVRANSIEGKLISSDYWLNTIDFTEQSLTDVTEPFTNWIIPEIADEELPFQ